MGVHFLFADNTSLNNNNNNNSLNANHTITYADKSTQTVEDLSPTSESRIAETQTDTAHSDSICCLNSIPYVDQSMTPPVVHKQLDTADNHIESKNPFAIDMSVGAATQTAMAITTVAQQLDNGDLPHENCNEVL
jgi:hypothetical protein